MSEKKKDIKQEELKDVNGGVIFLQYELQTQDKTNEKNGGNNYKYETPTD